MAGANLPSARAVLFGRDADIAVLTEQVLKAPGRLVTVTGCGGAGKTSVAAAVARLVAGEFADGAWFVELARVTTADGILGAVMSELGMREPAAGDLASDLRDFLAQRQVLVVLDNCEHLIDAVASLADSLLDAAPAVRILATSREPLRIAGEQVHALAPLPTPTGPPASAADLSAYASVDLFLDRAHAANAGLELTEHNAAAVAQICWRLDGIPLALELAAVRASTMSLDAMAERLADGFDMLFAKGRSRPERQQTMRATLEWSHGLLDEDEKAVLRRLGVFPGTWSLDAAEAVCAEDGTTDVAFVLGDLVDKSLVTATGTNGEMRYRLLAPVREYAVGRLAASNENDRVRDRHRTFFVALAERAELEIHRADQGSWIRRIDADLDNLRLAVQTAHTRADAESVLRLVGAMWWYLWQRGHLREGVRWLGDALDRPDVPVAARMAGLRAAAMLHGGLGHHEPASAFARECRDLAAAAGDQGQLARAETLLGMERLRQGDLVGTRPHFESALAAGRAAQDRVIIPHALVNLGQVAAVDEGAAAAESYFLDGLAEFEVNGDRWGVAYASNYLAGLRRTAGDMAGAIELSARAVGLLDELGDRFYLIFALEDLARAVAADRRPELGARLFGAAGSLRRTTGALLSPGVREEYDGALAEVQAAVGTESFARAWDEGAAQPIGELLREVHAPAGPAAASDDSAAYAGPNGALTKREVQVALLLATGLSNKEIANELVIAVGTAGVHVEHILRKLDLRSRHQVADWARERGMIE